MSLVAEVSHPVSPTHTVTSFRASCPHHDRCGSGDGGDHHDKEATAEHNLNEPSVEGSAVTYVPPALTEAQRWPAAKRWRTALSAMFITWTATFNVIGYPLLGNYASVDLKTSYLAVQLGNTAYISALAFAPLLLAPLSEAHGRKTVFLVSTAIYTLTIIPQALAPHIAMIIAFRFVNGAASSVGASMAGGTVADVFSEADRAFPMSLYSFAVWSGQAIGPILTALTIEQRGWRIVAWWNFGVGCLAILVVVFCMAETRPKRQDKDAPHRSPSELIRECLRCLWVPLRLLSRDPIVQSLSLWAAFLWSVNYVSVQAIPFIFSTGYNWSFVHQALVLMTPLPAGLLGLATNWHQDRIYTRKSRKAGRPIAEERLHYACLGAVLVPMALFLLAWTGRPNISPGWPIFALFLFNFAVFPIYTCLFSYLADAFESQASSAMAAQSFFRNLCASALPLVSEKLYTGLGSPIATSTLASISAVMAVTPFVLKRYGGRARLASSRKAGRSG